MFETLTHLFSAVCGQNPDHTWAPGGLLLPFCQRCTGLYAGGALAAILLAWYKPRLTGRFLWWHGLFLLGMAPFGFHWVEHGGMVRTMTGVLFGAGVVCFLWVGAKGGGNPKLETRNSKEIRRSKTEGEAIEEAPGANTAEMLPTAGPREASWSAVVLYRFRGWTETGKREFPVAAELSRQSARGQAHSKTLRAERTPGGSPKCDAQDCRTELNTGEPLGAGDHHSPYFLWIAITLVAVPLLARFGGRAAGIMLTALGLIGAGAFSLLILANLAQWLGTLLRISKFEFPSSFAFRISDFFSRRS